MEDSRLTQITLDIVRHIHARAGTRGAVGVVIQAYLYRSQADMEQLLADGIRDPAMQRRVQRTTRSGLSAQGRRGLKLSQAQPDASRKPDLPRAGNPRRSHGEGGQSLCCVAGIGHDQFEFQMLYGVRRDLQRELVRDGYKVRVYVPFGTEWYPYFMRRLAERPANVLFLARNFFRS